MKKISRQVRFRARVVEVIVEMKKNPTIFGGGATGGYINGATRKRVRELARKMTRQSFREEMA